MCRIMIIDDSEFVCRKVMSLLSEFHQCRYYTSGREAICAVDAFQPQIILLDIEMPELDGYRVCEAIKSQEYGQDAIVVFISSSEDIFSKVRAYDVGGHDFVNKPFADDEVVKKVAKIAALIKQREQLIQSETETSNVVDTTMKQASHYSYIMNFFKYLNHCNSSAEVASLFFAAMNNFGLRASLMLHMAETEFYSQPGSIDVGAIEKDVYLTLGSKKRFFEFNKRLMVNDKHVSFLIKNMPQSEIEAGEIRDLVAVIIEGVESQVVGLIRQDGLELATDQLKSSVNKVNKGIHQHQQMISSVVSDMISATAASFDNLELTEEQEIFFTEMFEEAGNNIMAVEDVLIDVQQHLEKLSQHLEVIIEDTKEVPVKDAFPKRNVELF